MATIRVEKTKNYTVLSNYHLREKNMSLKAKGLLTVMLSFPDEWDYSIGGLVSICKENETAIRATLKELKEFGYLEVIKKFPNETASGHIEYEYIVYEAPIKQEKEEQEVEEQEVENQGVENLYVEHQCVENQVQLNINNKINNNKIFNNKITKEKINKKENAISNLLNDFSFTLQTKEALIEAIEDFKEMRKAIRKPLTERALKGIINRLREFSKGNGDEAISILDNSIRNSWQDVYELKNGTSTTKATKKREVEDYSNEYPY